MFFFQICKLMKNHLFKTTTSPNDYAKMVIPNQHTGGTHQNNIFFIFFI